MTIEELMEINLNLKNDMNSLNEKIESQNSIIEDYKAKEIEFQNDAKKLRDLNMSLFLKVSDQNNQKTNITEQDTVDTETKKLSNVEQSSLVLKDLISVLTK